MALLPILAFFFCSAGPFLFVLFLIKKIFNKITDKFLKTNDFDRRGFKEVKIVNN